ncbi:MAG: hypothetical protein ABIJ73_03680 [Pseudomonadota bacterium]
MHLKIVGCLIVLAVAGCSARNIVSNVATTEHALLTVQDCELTPKQYCGINGVGEDPFQFEPRPSLYVKAGRREVWYACPGFVYTDTGPSIRYRFEPGKSYEVVCSGNMTTDFIRGVVEAPN